ncbi:hypothetical protein V8E55_009201 [Tylopilus felleus]
MTDVDFFILLDNHPVLVTTRTNSLLVKLFSYLHKDPNAAQYLPKQVPWRACDFYRLKNPVPLVGEDDDHEGSGNFNDVTHKVKEACLQESNRVPVNPTNTRVQHLSKEQLSDDHIYLVIQIPDPFEESRNAICKLQEHHDVLFKCLKVTVQKLGQWKKEDVTRNLQGGIMTNNISHLPSTFENIRNALARPRLYREPPEAHAESSQETDNTAERRDIRDIENARVYKTQFERVFELAATEPTVTSNREFSAFHNILRCFDEDVDLIADKDTSSSLKASNFTVHFIQPPFFSEIRDDSRGFKYNQEKSWGFPIFVDTSSTMNVCRKFTPRSDWMVISPQFRIPFIISEVISNKTQNDRWRMLVEAIPLARAGQFLLKPTSKKTFFVVAIYVTADLIASRYIVMPTEDGNAKKKGNTEKKDNTKQEVDPVSIHQKDFDLKKIDDQVDFLREMYNLATQIAAMSRDLDGDKNGSLGKIQTDASNVLSLSSTIGLRGTPGNTMDSIPERTAGSAGPQDEDDLGVFEAEDIQSVLRQMNYTIEFIPWGHPYLAVIVNKFDETHGYLKFVQRENELKVLRYLSEIESPSNHTIYGVQFWPVQGGTVISMPVAGGWLTSLDDPSDQLWSVAQQLVEGVAFMHEHNVAHMDLKPQNVIIPVAGGRLSIIDFSVSIRVPSPDATYNGVAGTEDYIAPEVRKGNYKPMLADLWSCGRTLEELCGCCHPSAERTTLLKIAKRLMNRDPEARPKMSDVLEQMAPTRRRGGNAAPSTLPRPLAPSVPALGA